MSQTIEYKDHTIVIEQDDHPINPREEDANLGRMLCRHTKYQLGDEHMADREEVLDILEGRRKDVVALPLYLYDHGNITMNTTGFSCPWDSGMVGCIYTTYEKIRSWFGVKRVTKNLIEKVRGILRSEVEIYDKYISGDVYAYVIKKGDDVVESCGGFSGDDALKDARNTIDHMTAGVTA